MKGWQWLLLGVLILAAVGGGVVATDPGVISDWPPFVKRFAQAIAYAEGYNVAGSIPQSRNNPGDISSGGVVLTYPTANDGWSALYLQVYKMFYGPSTYYNPTMSITEIAKNYAGDWSNWAHNVASYLGVSTDTTLQTLMTA